MNIKSILITFLFIFGISTAHADTILQTFTFPYGSPVPVDEPFQVQQTNCLLNNVRIQLQSEFLFHFEAYNSSPNSPATYTFFGPIDGNINAAIGVFEGTQPLVVNEISIPAQAIRVPPLQMRVHETSQRQYNEINLSPDFFELFQGEGETTLDYLQGNVHIVVGSSNGNGSVSHQVNEASRITIIFETEGFCPEA